MRWMWLAIFTLNCWYLCDSHSIGKIPTITGTYKLVKSENFDEFLKATGVSLADRQVFKSFPYFTEISRNGDEWKIKIISPLKTTEFTFKLGEEFVINASDGQESKSIITLEGGNVLVNTQKRKDQTIKFIREFTDDEMKLTLIAGNVVATRIYKKQE